MLICRQPETMKIAELLVCLVLGVSLAAPAAAAADWPQFMRTSEHAGDAADEELKLPLGLVAQVKLDDAVMTSPAVVGGLVYVVDQMGTAYCVEPKTSRIVWKTSPEGDRAMGSNTSSPCVAKGRMYYGTTAGNLHILDCSEGKVVKTIDVGSPIFSAVTFANDSVYFQALDAVVRCLDLDGTEKWTWDHYRRYQEPPEVAKAEARRRGHPGSYDRTHYGGGEVAVSGTKVVTSTGWDVFCLEDKGKSAELAWCRRCPAGRDGAAPMSSSICGEWVYTAGMGADGASGLMRFALKDGTGGSVPGIAYPWITPAVRGSAITTRSSSYAKDIILLHDCEAKTNLARWQDDRASTPVISSHTLTKEHCLVTTLRGELVAFAIDARRGGKPLRLKTPNGKGIGSTPVVSQGCVFFGCDDGYLYVYGPGGALQPVTDGKSPEVPGAPGSGGAAPAVHEPRSKAVPAAGRSYRGSTFVDDPELKPPFRVKWAVRSFGHFKFPCMATAEGDLVSLTLQHTVTCMEQTTGRMRWRTRLPPPSEAPSLYGEEFLGSAGIQVADGRVYVACPSPILNGKLLCLDLRDGRILWSAPIGAKHIWLRAAPLVVDGKVIFSHLKKGTPPVGVIEAWDAETGKPAWELDLEVPNGRNPAEGPGASASGCAKGNVLYFSAGDDILSIDARSGKVLWRINVGGGYPALAGDKLLVLSYERGMRCLSPADGKLLWQVKTGNLYMASVGPDFIVLRGYGGAAAKLRLADGQPYPGLQSGGQLGGDTHACGSVAITPALSLAVTVGGLNVRDVNTGALLWLSPGFAPRACGSVTVSNGRVFYPSTASGVVFCWEPEMKR